MGREAVIANFLVQTQFQSDDSFAHYEMQFGFSVEIGPWFLTELRGKFAQLQSKAKNGIST